VTKVGLLHLEVITPERVMLSEDVDMVEARGALGEFGILPGHINFLTSIVPGEVRYMTDGKTRHLATSGGFAEVVADKVTFLLETAEFAEEIDVDRARRAKEKAESALKALSSDEKDYKLFELALLRAITRISTASKMSP
jgi:F-type H+-transporting ATPase subunit epsilon